MPRDLILLTRANIRNYSEHEKERRRPDRWPAVAFVYGRFFALDLLSVDQDTGLTTWPTVFATQLFGGYPGDIKAVNAARVVLYHCTFIPQQSSQPSALASQRITQSSIRLLLWTHSPPSLSSLPLPLRRTKFLPTMRMVEAAAPRSA